MCARSSSPARAAASAPAPTCRPAATRSTAPRAGARRRRKADGSIDYSDDSVRDGGGRVTLRIFESLKPVIARDATAPAVGIGVTMQLPMDIRIASTEARFGFVFSRRGIVPEAASSWFLPRLVGIQQALEWTYSGRVFPAEEALAGRPRHARWCRRTSCCRRRARSPRRSSTTPRRCPCALIRQMMWKMLTADHPMEAHKVDCRGIYSRGASADVKEGVTSFLEKRPPKFADKVSKDMPPYFPWWEEQEVRVRLSFRDAAQARRPGMTRSPGDSCGR